MPYCEDFAKADGWSAADVSIRLNNKAGRKFLAFLRRSGVTMVIRSYARSARPKTIIPEEAKLLSRQGFGILPIFQDSSPHISNFSSSRRCKCKECHPPARRPSPGACPRYGTLFGVSQPTAWRMGHALRLMVARENMLDGTVEIDHFHLGKSPKAAGSPTSGTGPEMSANTEKAPVMAMVQRPTDVTPGTPAGDVRAAVVTDLSARANQRVIEAQIESRAH